MIAKIKAIYFYNSKYTMCKEFAEQTRDMFEITQ
jgi:hypothetical protein